MSSEKRQKTDASDGVTVRLGAGGLLQATGKSSVNPVTMELAGMSAESKQRADDLLKQLEAKRRARSIAVPTNDMEVRRRLRQLGEPITYFGEGPANRRERLRTLLAQLAVEAASGITTEKTKKLEALVAAGDADLALGVTERVTKKAYDTDGSAELLNARFEILRYSVPRARTRLLHAKRKRANMTKEIMAELDKAYANRALKLKSFVNSSSQIGGARPLAACAFSPDSKNLATASWSGVCKLWSVPGSSLVCNLKGHEDRVSDIQYHPHSGITIGSSVDLATAGVDGTLRLWSLSEINQAKDEKMDTEKVTSTKKAMEEEEDEKEKKEGEDEEGGEKVPAIKAISVLKGHEDRLSRVAFHPSGNFIASSSYDATWRLWDLTVQKELLKQDGHAVGVYGLGFQSDGSVLATGDVGGIIRVWDLRSGRPVASLDGHVDNVLSIQFAPNGHNLATGSCDNSLRIWDLRKRRCAYTILAHSKLISNVCYHPNNGDFLLSSSYDNTVKIWSARDYQLINTLHGHEGRVMRVQMSADGKMIASTSFDRTWKLWMADED